MKSLRFIIFLLIAAVLSLIYFHQTADFDQDLGRHLKLGEIIVNTKKVPSTNLFSYTHPDEPVLNHHWGSQVVFYLIHRASGVNALILLNTIIGTLTLLILIYTATNHPPPTTNRQRPTANFLIALIALIALIPFIPVFVQRSTIRPEIFANLLFALIYSSIFIKSKKIKYFFPLIILAWTNLHLSFLIGLAAAVIILLSDIINHFQKSPKKFSFSIFNSQFSILVLTLLAPLFNPQGLQGVIKSFNVFQKYGYSIVENQSIPFLLNYGNFLQVHYTLIALGALIFSSILAYRRFLPRQSPFSIFHSPFSIFSELLILALLTLLTFKFIRVRILFALAAYLTTALNFNYFYLKYIKPKLHISKHKLPSQLFIFYFLFSIFPLLFISLIARNLLTRLNLPSGLGNQEHYKNVLDFSLSHRLPAPILNNFDIGGYLIYRLYPQHQVFVDNRPEAYPVDFFQKTYIPLQQNPNLFNQITQKYNIKTIIWSHTDMTPWSQTFLKTLTQHPNWHLAYLDGYTLIYISRVRLDANQSLPPFNHQMLIQELVSKKDLSSLVRLRRYYFITNQKEYLKLMSSIMENG